MKNIEIYTDGACSGNPGAGGWGAVLIYAGREKEISGFQADTTNNRMELMAVIKALEAITEPCNIKLYSDSAYVINAFKEGWLEAWQQNSWRTSTKKEVKNPDLWQALLCLAQKHNITWIKVKGHSDNVYNNRCDTLATGEIAKQPIIPL
ncbi:MAG: ribonuclease HI [Firmicutes bacterium]|nr:ribonuclease HI [Bacillota bacterium]